MMMLVPEAWDGNKDMQDPKKSFYEYIPFFPFGAAIPVHCPQR
jgi:hypothetical protein